MRARRKAQKPSAEKIRTAQHTSQPQQKQNRRPKTTLRIVRAAVSEPTKYSSHSPAATALRKHGTRHLASELRPKMATLRRVGTASAQLKRARLATKNSRKNALRQGAPRYTRAAKAPGDRGSSGEGHSKRPSVSQRCPPEHAPGRGRRIPTKHGAMVLKWCRISSIHSGVSSIPTRVKQVVHQQQAFNFVKMGDQPFWLAQAQGSTKGPTTKVHTNWSLGVQAIYNLVTDVVPDEPSQVSILKWDPSLLSSGFQS